MTLMRVRHLVEKNRDQRDVAHWFSFALREAGVAHVSVESFASILACPQHVRLGGNLGYAGCPVLPVEDIGLDVIQAPKPEPRIMRYELTDLEWAAIVGPRVPHAVRRLLAVRRRAGTQLAHEPPITMWAPDQQRTTPRSGRYRIRPTNRCLPLFPKERTLVWHAQKRCADQML